MKQNKICFTDRACLISANCTKSLKTFHYIFGNNQYYAIASRANRNENSFKKHQHLLIDFST